MTSITNTATRKPKRTGRIGTQPSRWFERMAKATGKVFNVRCTVPNMTPVRAFVMPNDFSL